MNLTTYSLCVLAGSTGGMITGYYAGRGRPRRRPASRAAHRQTMRSWPGPRRRDPRRPDGGRDAGTGRPGGGPRT